MHEATILVLLVEGDEAHAELIQLSFEARRDLRLRIARSLREARDRLAESTPDLMVVDSLLPDGRGLDLLSEHPVQSIPVVLLTSHADPTMKAEALASGASRYVVKSEVTLLDMPEIVDDELRRWQKRSTASEPAVS